MPLPNYTEAARERQAPWGNGWQPSQIANRNPANDASLVAQNIMATLPTSFGQNDPYKLGQGYFVPASGNMPGFWVGSPPWEAQTIDPATGKPWAADSPTALKANADFQKQFAATFGAPVSTNGVPNPNYKPAQGPIGPTGPLSTMAGMGGLNPLSSLAGGKSKSTGPKPWASNLMKHPLFNGSYASLVGGSIGNDYYS